MPAFSRSFLFCSSIAFHRASASADPRSIAKNFFHNICLFISLILNQRTHYTYTPLECEGAISPLRIRTALVAQRIAFLTLLANREIKRPFSPTINLSLSPRVVNRNQSHACFGENCGFAGSLRAMHRPDVADFATVWTLARVRAKREGRPSCNPRRV